ncbi:hypothetical protein [Caldibacillus debilis]|uniref:hypothetical protein n=1 Tax=Caldibacillus debilis TaxID=301148 RepID=UPI000EAABBF1|nr:hypothetical protein [Caldibacillus debilis]
MKEWLEQPTVIDDEEKAIQEEAREKKDRGWYRKIKWMSALLIVMILALAVGIYALLQYRENLREKESLSVDDAVEFFTPGETAYEDYARLLESHGIQAEILFLLQCRNSERGAGEVGSPMAGCLSGLRREPGPDCNAL